ERDHIVFKVTAIAGNRVDIDYLIVESGVEAITLDYGVEGQDRKSVAEGQGGSVGGGGFSWKESTGRFNANNDGPRGNGTVGACADLAKVAIPAQGYARGKSFASVGECYVSLTPN